MKILIVNPHMKIGGIASSLVNWLYYFKDNTDYEVDLLIFDDVFDEKYESVKRDFNVICLDEFKYLRLSHKNLDEYRLKWKFFYIILFALRKLGLANVLIRRIFKNYSFKGDYDLVISYSNDIPRREDNVLSNDFVEYSVTSKRKVAWIHNDVERLGFTSKFAKRRYRNFDFIINVSSSCKEQFDKLVPDYEYKSLVVSNPINIRDILNNAKKDVPVVFRKDIFNFVTVARISQQKRIDRLLGVAEALNNAGLDFNWYVLGGGSNLESFINQCKVKGLESKVFFRGFINNPYPFINNADYFVLTSDYEAQPVAMLEALSLSTPVITTDIPIMYSYINEGVNGYITQKKVESIVEVMESIIQNNIKLKGFKFEYDTFEVEFNRLVEKLHL